MEISWDLDSGFEFRLLTICVDLGKFPEVNHRISAIEKAAQRI